MKVDCPGAGSDVGNIIRAPVHTLQKTQVRMRIHVQCVPSLGKGSIGADYDLCSFGEVWNFRVVVAVCGPARIRTWDQGIMSPLLYR